MLIVARRTSQSFVRKKAALTLLRLYRKHPEVIPAAEWALRIVSIMDDMDLVSTISVIHSYAHDISRVSSYASPVLLWHSPKII